METAPKLRHFTVLEFDSPDAPNSGINMDRQFLEMLDNARSIAQTPFVITSGFRTASHNKKVGGSAVSMHLTGKAADIKCTASHQRWLIMDALRMAGLTRIGVGKNFIHVDCGYIGVTGMDKMIWTYGNK